jgi:hypothetical protein
MHSVNVAELPHRRRARADANIRRSVGDLRALAVEDPMWQEFYEAIADTFESALKILDAIEDIAP